MSPEGGSVGGGPGAAHGPAAADAADGQAPAASSAPDPPLKSRSNSRAGASRALALSVEGPPPPPPARRASVQPEPDATTWARFLASCALVLLAPALVSAVVWLVPYGSVWPPARWTVTFLAALTIYFPCGALTCWWLGTYRVFAFCVAAYACALVPVFLAIGLLVRADTVRAAFAPYIVVWFALVGAVSFAARRYLRFLDRRAGRARPEPALGYWSFVARMSFAAVLALLCPAYVLLFAALRWSPLAQTLVNLAFNTIVLVYALLWAFVAWRPMRHLLPHGDAPVVLFAYVMFAHKLFKASSFFRLHGTSTFAAMLATEVAALVVPVSLVYRRLRLVAAAALRRLVPAPDAPSPPSSLRGMDRSERRLLVLEVAAGPGAGGPLPEEPPAVAMVAPSRRGSAARRWSAANALEALVARPRAHSIADPDAERGLLAESPPGGGGQASPDVSDWSFLRVRRSSSGAVVALNLPTEPPAAAAPQEPRPLAGRSGEDDGDARPDAGPEEGEEEAEAVGRPSAASFRVGFRAATHRLLVLVTEEEGLRVRDGVPSLFLVNALVSLSSSLSAIVAMCAGRWGPAADVSPFAPAVLPPDEFRSAVTFCVASSAAVTAVAAAAAAVAPASRALRDSLFVVGRRFIAQRGWLLAMMFVNAPIFPLMVLIKPNRIFSVAFPDAYPP